LTCHRLGCVLVPPVLGQDIMGEAQERQVPPPSFGLDRAPVEHPSHPHKLLTDANLSLGSVNIAPAQAQYLATPEPIEQ